TQIGGADHRDTVLARIRITAKTGAPTRAVTTPMGKVCPGIMIRDMISAAIRKTMPISAEAGTSRAWRTPTRNRAAWGTTSPTKPIEPVIDTMTAVAIAAATIRTT